MEFAIEFTFKTTVEIFKFIIKFIFYSLWGLGLIIFNMQFQRIFTLLLISLFTIGDLYIVVPKMKSGIEPFIHLFICLLPLIYLAQIGKKGVN